MSNFDKQSPTPPTGPVEKGPGSDPTVEIVREDRSTKVPLFQPDHEPNLVNVRAVLATAASLVLMVLIVLGLTAALTDWFASRAESEDERTEKTSSSDISSLSAPLDVDQPQHLGKLRAAEEKQLSSYGWTNRTEQIARIPIERAMELISEKGLADIPIAQPPAKEVEPPPQARDEK